MIAKCQFTSMQLLIFYSLLHTFNVYQIGQIFIHNHKQINQFVAKISTSLVFLSRTTLADSFDSKLFNLHLMMGKERSGPINIRATTDVINDNVQLCRPNHIFNGYANISFEGSHPRTPTRQKINFNEKNLNKSTRLCLCRQCAKAKDKLIKKFPLMMKRFLQTVKLSIISNVYILYIYNINLMVISHNTVKWYFRKKPPQTFLRIAGKSIFLDTIILNINIAVRMKIMATN